MAASNITAIVAGVAAAIGAVDGIVNVYQFEPEKVGSTPAAVLRIAASRPLYPDETNSAPYGALTLEWMIDCYLLFKDTNFAASEADIATYLPAVIEALGHDLNAGSAILDGEVRVIRFTPGYYTNATQRYHAVRIEIRAIETVVYTYAL